MGRLFWKFFIAILLAQFGATIAIGGAIWLRNQSHSDTLLEAGPPGVIALDAAQSTLRHGGLDALRALLGQLQHPQVYVLDAGERDLLGRAVPAELRQEVKQQATMAQSRSTRWLSGADGTRYLAFASRVDGNAPPPGLAPPPGRGLGHLVGIGAAVLASLLCAALLAWYFSRPIRALRSAFEAAAAGDLAPRFARESAGGDELSDLGRDFDRMSQRLRTVMETQRRLLHDVSHELRSPLARLQAAVGLAHQQPDRISTSLARIEREGQRMDLLVGELLTLSRLEATPEVLRCEKIDLADLIDSVIADARFELEQAGTPNQHSAHTNRIRRTGTMAVQLQADPHLLARAIDNVVRNALLHGRGGDVEVELTQKDGKAAITILDHGPGVAPEHLGAIFTPFYRAGAAEGSVQGHGLGLAIAQRVIHAHGGAITASNRSQGGLAVRITLPVA